MRIYKYKDASDDDDEGYIDRRIRKVRIEIAYHLKMLQTIMCRETVTVPMQRDMTFMIGILPKKLFELDRLLSEYIERYDRRKLGVNTMNSTNNDDHHSLSKHSVITSNNNPNYRLINRINSSLISLLVTFYIDMLHLNVMKYMFIRGTIYMHLYLYS